MDIEELNQYFTKFKYGANSFQNLMKKRVVEILLISTFYDAFIFEQDGSLSEQLLGEYSDLNLSTPAHITSVPTGEQALEEIANNRFDLVITVMRIGEITPFELANWSKKLKPELPIFLLLNVQSDIGLVEKESEKMKNIDNVFLWRGDSKVFLAMIKHLEDKLNVAHDTKEGMSRVILLVEDSIYFYSQYLPELYREIVTQTMHLIAQDLSDTKRNIRMRSRPKVLMAHTFEEAMGIWDEYKDFIIGVITDLSFDKDGVKNDGSGELLVKILKEQKHDLPVIIQSSEPEAPAICKELGVKYIDKSSEFLMEDISSFIRTELGFGSFIFRNKGGRAIDVADTISEFEEKLATISDETMLYHTRRNHFSAWLIAHGAISVARRLRPLTEDDFSGTQDLRKYLIDAFYEVHENQNKGQIVDFSIEDLDTDYRVFRLAKGSLGGKGRGLAFLNQLLASLDALKFKFPAVEIKLPRTAFIGVSEFNKFIDKNDLWDALYDPTLENIEIRRRFAKGNLSTSLRKKLSSFLDYFKKPIAVRSSGLLEDSRAQPFAGVYYTYMLPNNHEDKIFRLEQLELAIKMVMASTYSKEATEYIERLSYKANEEKMAVIIQEIAGTDFDGYFYPHISGVVQSHNYYPTSYAKHEDGVASIALGLGQWVVGGNDVHRFVPRYPKQDILTNQLLLKNSQTEFFALDLSKNNVDLTASDAETLTVLPISEAEKNGSLKHLVSTWDETDQRLRAGLESNGPRLLNFADILKYDYFPLASILDEIMDIGEKALGVPVEIEFAVKLKTQVFSKTKPGFYLLQIRPLSVQTEDILILDDEVNKDELFLYTEEGMGNGVVENIHDIVFVNPDSFDKTQTLEMKEELKKINSELICENRHYILIGVGRWGSRDRFLGVPVQWPDISGARVIVECGLPDFIVEASQGTHFFHNLVATDAGYLTVPFSSEKAFVDWNYLKSLPIQKKTKYFTHVRRDDKAFLVKMYGHEGLALLYK